LILDTNALSAFVDGEPTVGTILGRSSRAAIPAIVLGAFRYGIADSRRRKTYEAWLDLHLGRFELLEVSAETTLPYAELRAALKRMGRPIPAHYAWIAALAIQHRLPILSRDRHFDAIPDVQRIDW
jgi:predicted nucleic acid-binding protein